MQATASPRALVANGSLKRWLLLEDESPSLMESCLFGINTPGKIAVTVVFIIALSLLAQAKFFLPDNPVPITFQTFGVLIMGGVLGWRWGAAGAVGYYLVGMAGLPVFASGNNGWDYIAHGATGGYLLGFILSTTLVGFLSQHGWNRSRSLWPMLLGGLALYVPALIWLSVFDFGWPADGELFSSAMYPFIPGDLVKLMLASVVVGAAWKFVDHRTSNRQQ